LYLQKAKEAFRNEINVASQDVGINGNGAFTGELSAALLTDSGITWTLTGHSERRVGFGYPVRILTCFLNTFSLNVSCFVG
jgi:triosephosphate isomerase